MGVFTKAKHDELVKAATAARSEGRRVFVYRYIEKLTNSRMSAPMPDLAEAIEAVEALGWRLDRLMSPKVEALTGDRTAYVMMFRAPVGASQ
jgi:hypothetical protein